MSFLEIVDTYTNLRSVDTGLYWFEFLKIKNILFCISLKTYEYRELDRGFKYLIMNIILLQYVLTILPLSWSLIRCGCVFSLFFKFCRWIMSFIPASCSTTLFLPSLLLFDIFSSDTWCLPTETPRKTKN